MVAQGAAARRQQNRREMREAIVDAAGRIVSTQGAEALTMRAVGQAIGYSAAALYEYFPAKEELYAALYFDGQEGLAGRMRETLADLPPNANGRNRLLALAHAYRAFARERPELFRLAFGEAMAERETGHDAADKPDEGCGDPAEGKDAFGLLVDVAAAGIAEGEFAPMPPMTLAVAAWTAIHGFVILELNGHIGHHGPANLRAAEPGPPSPDELFGAIARLFVDSVSRRAAAPAADP